MAKVRLANDPRSIQTKSGVEMTSGYGFADVSGESGMAVGLVCFNNLAKVFLKYKKGDTIRIAGTLKENNYTGKDGTEREGFQVVVDALMGIKAARTQYQERRPIKDSQQPRDPDRVAATDEFYNDEISF